MTILGAGSCIGPYVPADGSCLDNIVTTFFDTSFVRNSIYLSGSSTYAECEHHANATDFWFTGDLYIDTAGGTEVAYLELYNSSSILVYKLTGSTSGGVTTFRQYTSPDGSAFTQRGTSFTANIDTRHTFSVHLNTDGTGSAEVYVSGTQRLTYSGDLSGLSNVKFHRLKGSLVTYWSQCVWKDGESTIGTRIGEMVATGNGATDQWTSSYTSIDETAYSDADFIFSDTANQIELFALTPVGTFSGYTARAVIVAARAKTDGSGPTNLQLSVKSGATTSHSASHALSAGYTANVSAFETDPNTTLDWSMANALVIQTGVKSIA